MTENNRRATTASAWAGADLKLVEPSDSGEPPTADRISVASMSLSTDPSCGCLERAFFWHGIATVAVRRP